MSACLFLSFLFLCGCLSTFVYAVKNILLLQKIVVFIVFNGRYLEIIHTYIYIYIHTYIYIYIYIYIYTHTHTHTCIPVMTRVFFGNVLSYPVPETITNHHYRLQIALWDRKSLENLLFLRFHFDKLGQEKAAMT